MRVRAGAMWPAAPACPAIAAAVAWLDDGAGDRTVVVLVRHGEVENPRAIRYGLLPGFRLSERGRAQAERAGRRLAPLAPWVRTIRASPLERTVETAERIAPWVGGPAVEPDDALIEAASRFDGGPRRAALSRRHLVALGNPFRPSWAEPFAAVGDRMRRAIGAAEATARGGAAILVGHQSPIWLGVLAVEGEGPGLLPRLLRPLPPWLRRPVRCRPGALTVLRFAHGRLAAPPAVEG